MKPLHMRPKIRLERSVALGPTPGPFWWLASHHHYPKLVGIGASPFKAWLKWFRLMNSIETSTEGCNFVIRRCSDPHYWYANLVGHVVTIGRFDRHTAFTREPAGYINIIEYADLEIYHEHP